MNSNLDTKHQTRAIRGDFFDVADNCGVPVTGRAQFSDEFVGFLAVETNE